MELATVPYSTFTEEKILVCRDPLAVACQSTKRHFRQAQKGALTIWALEKMNSLKTIMHAFQQQIQMHLLMANVPMARTNLFSKKILQS